MGRSAATRPAKDEYSTLNGTTGYVSVPDSANYSPATTGALTVSVWMRPSAVDFPTTIDGGADGRYVDWLGKGDYLSPTQFEWNFRMYNKTSPTRPNRISFYLFNLDAGQGVGSYFQDSVIFGEWIHVVGTVTSLSGDHSTRMYKNGVLRDTDDYRSSPVITPADGIAPLYFGTTSLGDPSFFKGDLKDVRIWNRALSDAEVLQVYQGNDVLSGLVGKWLLNEQSGAVATDSVNGNNGAFVGGRSYGTNWPARTDAGTRSAADTRSAA